MLPARHGIMETALDRVTTNNDRAFADVLRTRDHMT